MANKKYNQSNQAKKEFKSVVYDYMCQDPQRTYTKEELAAHFGYTCRAIRNCISRVANYYPIIATSDKKGYKLAHWTMEMDSQELNDVNEEILHEIAELNSRIKELKARLKPLIANKVVLTKRIETLKNLEECEELVSEALYNEEY